MNAVVISGHMGKAIELRYTQKGTAVGSMSIGVKRKMKDQDGNYPTDWINVTVWGVTAENTAKYTDKGSKVIVKGRIETSNYEKDGVRHYKTEVVAEEVEFSGKAGQGQGQEPKQAVSGDKMADWEPMEDIDEDMLPF